MGNSSGKVLGVIALMIALGVAGLEVYQLLTDSTGSIHVATWEDIVPLDSGYTTIPTNITFDLKSGDLVLFDYTCQITLDISPILTYISVQYMIDGVAVLDSAIHVQGDQTADPQNIHDSAGMRYFVSNMTAGEHNVTIRAFTDDPSANSFVRYSVLTVQIYK